MALEEEEPEVGLEEDLGFVRGLSLRVDKEWRSLSMASSSPSDYADVEGV